MGFDRRVHVDIAATEAQATSSIATYTYRTRPIVAEAVHIAERAIAVAADAGHRQF